MFEKLPFNFDDVFKVLSKITKEKFLELENFSQLLVIVNNGV